MSNEERDDYVSAEMVEAAPNDVEHVRRVGSADEVGSAQHVSHVGELHVQTAGFAEERLRVVKWLALVLGSVAVVLALFTSAFVLYSRNSAAEEVTRQVQELKDQLAQTQKNLDDAKSNADAANVCTDRLSRNISAASQGESSALIHLVIQLARQQTYDISAAEAADKAYFDAVNLRDQWVEAGRPLPCPLPS